MKKMPIKHLLDFLGIQKYRTGHTEKIISGIGAFFGIFIVLFSSTYFIKDDSAFFQFRMALSHNLGRLSVDIYFLLL